MALETVRITLLSDDLVPEPVDGVVVRVYDASGTTLVTSGTSGDAEPGVVDFTLDGDEEPVEYQLRFYKFGASIVSPQRIAVYSPADLSPTEANNFEVEVVEHALEEATDPRLCRCSGLVRGPDGRPKRGIDIHFIPRFNPLVVDGAAVLGERIAVRTDADGFVSVDLFRKGIYDATVESHENVQRCVYVPDRSHLGIAELLFPVVASVTYDPEPPLELAVDEELVLIPEVRATDHRNLGMGLGDVAYQVDDTSIASIQVLSDRIIVRGNAPGTTTLRATRLDESIVYIPYPGIDGGAVSIVVT